MSRSFQARSRPSAPVDSTFVWRKKGRSTSFLRWGPVLESYAALARTGEVLRECNDPVWLDEFSRRVRRQGKNFEIALSDHAAQLERRKAAIFAGMARVRHGMKKINAWNPEESPATSADLRRAATILPAGLKGNPQVHTRNFTVRKYGQLSDLRI